MKDISRELANMILLVTNMESLANILEPQVLPNKQKDQ